MTRQNIVLSGGRKNRAPHSRNVELNRFAVDFPSRVQALFFCFRLDSPILFVWAECPAMNLHGAHKPDRSCAASPDILLVPYDVNCRY